MPKNEDTNDFINTTPNDLSEEHSSIDAHFALGIDFEKSRSKEISEKTETSNLLEKDQYGSQHFHYHLHNYPWQYHEIPDELKMKLSAYYEGKVFGLYSLSTLGLD